VASPDRRAHHQGEHPAVLRHWLLYPPVEDPYCGLCAAVELTAAIDRRDWRLAWRASLPMGGEVLGFDVELSAHVELVKEG
jgi:hypothetical protein